MTTDEALLVLGVYRFARQRVQHGERLTIWAANKIAAIARIIDIHAERVPSELGMQTGDIWWTTDVLRSAAFIVERRRCGGQLLRLEKLLADLRVADVEGYEEPEDATKPERPAPEDTGVYVLTPQRFGRS